jgi:hypothetical protein
LSGSNTGHTGKAGGSEEAENASAWQVTHG